jgi:hypothetical protein
MKATRPFLLSAVIALVTATSALPATLAVSNLGETSLGNAAISPFGGDANGSALAQAFTTGTLAPGFTAFNLDSLTFSLSEQGGDAPGSVTVQLYTVGGGNIPGTLLATLTGPDPVGSTPANYSYTPTAPFSLAPSTTYFAVLTTTQPSVSSGPFYRAAVTGSTSETGLPGWSIADFSRQNGGGSVWVSDSPVQLEVMATAVPEPSSVALLAGVLGGFVALRLRRAHRSGAAQS